MKSSRAEAATSPTTHSFHRGYGYVRHPSVPAMGLGPMADCDPPAQTAAGSAHRLGSGRGGAELVATWHPGERAWLRDGGARLGFTAAYLSSHGWTYLGPVA